ncbi:hypothetical protein ACJJIF_18340 [Microbulbifer sp. SSSA002]|uniref:hypothetical protein n=1 Tax=Microbulbifer sp. SSSA002 TaxID=3243376 RepID=UPI00403A7821
MQITIFPLQNPDYISDNDPVYQQSDAVFRLPQLPAYAIHHSQITLGHEVMSETAPQQPEYHLTADTLVLSSRCLPMLGDPNGWLTVYHNGVRDYQLLFPHIDNDGLQRRLGQFAEEADNAFNSQSWLSYVLMVGGVLEGLLFHHYKNGTFSKMTNSACKDGLINSEEKEQIDEVRDARNKIHAGRYEQSLPGRALALDISITYDKLLKRDWAKQENMQNQKPALKATSPVV